MMVMVGYVYYNTMGCCTIEKLCVCLQFTLLTKVVGTNIFGAIPFSALVNSFKEASNEAHLLLLYGSFPTH